MHKIFLTMSFPARTMNETPLNSLIFSSSNLAPLFSILIMIMMIFYSNCANLMEKTLRLVPCDIKDIMCVTKYPHMRGAAHEK